jgi:hypothetical protein
MGIQCEHVRGKIETDDPPGEPRKTNRENPVTAADIKHVLPRQRSGLPKKLDLGIRVGRDDRIVRYPKCGL